MKPAPPVIKVRPRLTGILPGTRRRAAQRSGCLDLDGADAGKGISDDLGRIRIWDHIDPASALPTVYIERG
jgi:hypothetical protein